MSGQPGPGGDGRRGQPRTQSAFNPTIPALILGIIILVVAAVLSIRTLSSGSPADLLAELEDSVAGSRQSSQSEGEVEAEVEVDGGEGEVAAAAPTLTSATVFSWADDDGDHPELVSALVDGDPGTQWRSRYFNTNTFDEGTQIALLLTLAEPATVSEVDITFAGQGGDIVVRNASDGNPRTGPVLASAQATGETIIKLAQPEQVTALSIVFNELPVDDEGLNRAKISAVTLK